MGGEILGCVSQDVCVCVCVVRGGGDEEDWTRRSVLRR